jgi:hypothetical protein
MTTLVDPSMLGKVSHKSPVKIVLEPSGGPTSHWRSPKRKGKLQKTGGPSQSHVPTGDPTGGEILPEL